MSKKTAKKLFTSEDTTDGNGDGCADADTDPRYLLAPAYDSMLI